MTTPTPWADFIRSFEHTGPGGDRVLEQSHPALVTTIRSIPVGSTAPVAGVPVTRQSSARWAAAGDTGLASPWVVIQSIRSLLIS